MSVCRFPKFGHLWLRRSYFSAIFMHFPLVEILNFYNSTIPLTSVYRFDRLVDLYGIFISLFRSLLCGAIRETFTVSVSKF